MTCGAASGFLRDPTGLIVAISLCAVVSVYDLADATDWNDAVLTSHCGRTVGLRVILLGTLRVTVTRMCGCSQKGLQNEVRFWVPNG